jgi:hypothetical protein
MSQQRLTKIVATVGPVSESREQLTALLRAGVNVIRLNASHGDFEFFKRVTEDVRSIAAEMGSNVAILMDLRGPKIRVGKLVGGGPVELVAGESLVIEVADFEGDVGRVPCTYENLAKDVRAGDQILLDDGLMELRVKLLLSDTAIGAVPTSVVHGAHALGFSRATLVGQVVLPAARAGIGTGVLLAAARALGETMAVLMVSGNVVQLPHGMLDPVRTLTANIALEMSYAMADHRAALFASGLVLLLIVAVLVVLAERFDGPLRHA